MWKSIKRIFNNLKIGFFLGMKSADEQLIHNDNVADDINSGIHQQQQDHRVAHHLLKGEITTEVEELRYRTHIIDRESKAFDYYSPHKAMKVPNKLENKKIKFYNNDRYELITIQPNKAIGDGVYDTLETVDTETVTTDKNGEVKQNIGRLKKNHKFTLEIDRNHTFTPRYYIEEYTKKLVCLLVDKEKEECVLDFYVTKYPNDKDWKSKGFVREVEYMKNDRRRSDVTEINSVAFITAHAYKFYDGISFKFKDLKYKEVIEFDGDYIIRFTGIVSENAKDYIDKYYSESMAKKYAENAPKEAVVNFNPYDQSEVRTYRCSICGKEVTYDPRALDQLAESDPDAVNNGPDVTEFMDMEASEQTFGRMICKDCLAKHKEEIMKQYQERNGGHGQQ